MRIAQVASCYYPQIGGIEKYVQRLAAGCVEAGDDVTVFTNQTGRSATEEWIDGVRIVRFPLTVKSRYYPLSVPLFRQLRSRVADYDVVHAHGYHTVVGHAAVGAGIPFIFTPYYHGTGHSPSRAALHKVYKPFGARQFRSASSIICISNPERELMIKHFPRWTDKIVVIPPGADARTPGLEQDRDSLSVLNLISGQRLVLSVNRLERYKNVDLIIRAFRNLAVSATLIVVGDGPDRLRLERIAMDSEPGWPVHFVGKISDSLLDALLEKATVVTSASDHEAFGLSVADGLSSGARVVASMIPAHAEIARLAGAGAPVSLVDPRNLSRFTELLASSLQAGRCERGRASLPTWRDAVNATRELYCGVTQQSR